MNPKPHRVYESLLLWAEAVYVIAPREAGYVNPMTV